MAYRERAGDDGAPNRDEGHDSGVLAAVLSVGVLLAPWSRPADGRGWPVLLAAAAVALIALLQFLWLYRARSARRWKAVLDAYAVREIARGRRRKVPPL
jgi:uncharacterized membrane protein